MLGSPRTTGGPTPPRCIRSVRWAALVTLAALTAVVAGLTMASAVAPRAVDRTLLVVGDSVVAQAATKLLGGRPVGTTVWVAAGVGSAPCDWVNGYRNPYYDDAFDSFSRE